VAVRSRRQGLLLRTLAGAAIVIVAITAAIFLRERAGNAPSDDLGIEDVLARDLPADVPRIQFIDRGQELTPPFRHFNGARSHRLPEDMGSGVAWGDCDDDGLPDLYVVSFAGPLTLTSAQLAEMPGNALYHNLGSGRFEEIGASAGVAIAEFGMGAAWGDYDGDGDLDLFVTNYGANRLFANDGACRFSEVSLTAGVSGGDAFSAGASWGDYDNDGDLDLYVTNYVEFLEGDDPARVSVQYGQNIPFTLNPSSYAPSANRLYRNEGSGTFAEIGVEAGVDNPDGRSMSAAWADMDLDGDLDLYVANDISDNAFFLNLGNGKFENIAAASLTADYRGAMGLTVDDHDRDGDLDFFVTHWLAQENALYTNHVSEVGSERLFFADIAEMVGLGYTGLKFVGWGTAFLDYDNDGWKDLFIANGSTLEDRDNPELLVPQRMQLFWKRGDMGYFDATDAAGPGLSRTWVARGAAAADWDADGDVDVAVLANGGPLLLLENQGTSGHWIEIDLRQAGANAFAVGALITVRTGEVRQLHSVGSTSSYLSQEPLTSHFGLGEASLVDDITVRWPDGTEEVWSDTSADRRLILRRGEPDPVIR
jgi:hypothetical protein